jgi:hypothetical protein
VNLTAFVGLNALGLDNLLQGSSRQMGITPALRLPIFDGKRLRAQLRGKQADLDTAIAQYNGAVLDAVKQAGDAVASVQSLQRQQQLQTESLSKAERAYDFAVQRYQAGLGSRSPCSTPKPSSSTSAAWPWTCRPASSTPAWPWPQPWAVAGATTPRLLQLSQRLPKSIGSPRAHPKTLNFSRASAAAPPGAKPLHR